jgi:uncharacterized membrane protein YqgA involved in biofilm formation
MLFATGLFFGLQQGISLANCLPRCSVNILWLLQNIGWLLTGIIVIVIGELIGVAFSIEKNTYKIVKAIEKQNDLYAYRHSVNKNSPDNNSDEELFRQ